MELHSSYQVSQCLSQRWLQYLHHWPFASLLSGSWGFAATSNKKEDEKETETPAAPPAPAAPAEKSITKSELLSRLQTFSDVAESDEVIAAIRDITENLEEHLN